MVYLFNCLLIGLPAYCVSLCFFPFSALDSIHHSTDEEEEEEEGYDGEEEQPRVSRTRRTMEEEEEEEVHSGVEGQYNLCSGCLFFP